MARQRDYRAEYRKRVERAAERGLTKAQAYGKGHRSKLPNVTDLVAAGQRAAPARRLGGGGRRRAGPLGSTVSESADAGDIKRSLQRAVRAGDKVVIGYKVETLRGVRSVALDGRRGKHIAAMEDHQPISPVTITQFPHNRASDGVPPSIVLAMIAEANEAGEDWWDDEAFWEDLLSSEYEEGDY